MELQKHLRIREYTQKATGEYEMTASWDINDKDTFSKIILNDDALTEHGLREMDLAGRFMVVKLTSRQPDLEAKSKNQLGDGLHRDEVLIDKVMKQEETYLDNLSTAQKGGIVRMHENHDHYKLFIDGELTTKSATKYRAIFKTGFGFEDGYGEFRNIPFYHIKLPLEESEYSELLNMGKNHVMKVELKLKQSSNEYAEYMAALQAMRHGTE